jgi:hypothetical protein
MMKYVINNYLHNSVALVRDRTLSTERPPLAGEVFIPTFVDRACLVVSATDPYGRINGFLDRKYVIIIIN